MRTRIRLWAVVVMVATLAACNRGERASVTGAYGEGVLTGQVTMAAGLGTSPAGVEVSLRGTGMTTTLGDDGRFTFGGVPTGAILDFRRGSDGIAASLEVGSKNGFLAVELSQGGASKSFKRRGGDVHELEGIIRSVAADSLVLFTSHREEITVALNAQTVIRKGRTDVPAADLQVGWRVHVKASKADDAYTALLVIVQNTSGDDGGDDDGDDGSDRARREYEGLVGSATADSLVLFTSRGQEVTFVLNPGTVIRKGNRILAATDLQPDWRVHVKATTDADGVHTARLVIVQRTHGGDDDGEDDGPDDGPAIVGYEGTVVSASATSLVIAARGGASLTFVLNSSTEYRKGTAADLVAGRRVNVKARVEGDTKIAVRVDIKK